MALFSSKSKNTKAKAEETTAVVAATPSKHINNLHTVIKRPRITEKASFSAEKNVYLFDVSPDANKKTIAAAVKELYKVTATKVNISKSPSKNVIVRGKRGVRVGTKKAYVYLEKGQTIEFA